MKTILIALSTLILGYFIAFFQWLGMPNDDQVIVIQRELNDPQFEATTRNSEQTVQPDKSVFKNKSINTTEMNDGYSGSWQQHLSEYEQGNPSYLNVLKLAVAIGELPVEEQQAFILQNLQQGTDENITSAVELLLTYFTEQNPQESLELLDYMDSEQRAEYGRNIMLGLAKSDAELAWQWIKSADVEGVGDFLAERSSGYAVAEVLSLAAKNPDIQFDIYQFSQNSEFFPRNIRRYSQNKIASTIAESNPYSALQLALDSDNPDRLLFESAIKKIAELNPDEAAGFILDNEDVATPNTIKVVTQAFLSEGENKDLTDFYDTVQDSKLKDRIAQNAVVTLSETDLEQAETWLNQIEDGRVRISAGYNMVKTSREQGDSSLDSELSFIHNHFSGSERAQINLYVNAYHYWIKQDKSTAQKVINSVSNSDSNVSEQVKKRLNIN